MINKENFEKDYYTHSNKDMMEKYGITLNKLYYYLDLFKIPRHTREDVKRLNSIKQSREIPRDELYQKFIIENWTRDECAEYFGCSNALLQKKCAIYGIKKDQNHTIENTHRKLMERYGTTKINIVGAEKKRKTNLERYEAETPFQSPTIQAKVIDTKIKQGNISDFEREVSVILTEYKIGHGREYIAVGEDNQFFSFDFICYDNESVFLIDCNGFWHGDKINSQENVSNKNRKQEEKKKYAKKNNIPYYILSLSNYKEELKKILND